MTKYIPVVRSRAAELRGLKELTNEVRQSLTPIVELTRSRRTSKNPGGDVAKSVEAVCDIFGDQPFIVDLTSLESLQNGEFARLLDPEDGFNEWVQFVRANLPQHSVPMVHLLEPFEIASMQSQVDRLAEHFGRFAVRVPTGYRDFRVFLDSCRRVFPRLENVVLTLDAGYVTMNTMLGALARLDEMLEQVGETPFSNVSIASSSFPNSVMSAGGGDNEGSFPLAEVTLWQALKAKFPHLDYGDYVAVHPMDFTGTVTNWVPRVDIMLEDSFYYYRYRRSDGGYVRAAQDAYRDARYQPLACWAEENIRSAVAGSPGGRSPSYWIANRVNFHLTRQALRVRR